MTTLILLVAVALAFDFINGFHDAANSIATVVSTRVLSPRQAVVWAAFFNFVAFLLFAPLVAMNIAKGVDPGVVDLTILGAGLFGAIVWDLVTWWLAIPTSSSHALLGGFAGAAVTKAGFSCLNSGFFLTTTAFILVAPVLGMVLGFALMVAVSWIFRRLAPSKVDRVFRRAQLVSAGLYSLGHGGNDAQKTMGIITAMLVTTGYHTAPVAGHKIPPPLWVVLACHAAMGLGTLLGGWRIVRTMGMKITKLRPVGGFCAETGGAMALFGATALGIPVSTTHTITGSIIGVGSVTKLSAVRWGVARRIVWAWILTIPASAGLAALAYKAVVLLRR